MEVNDIEIIHFLNELSDNESGLENEYSTDEQGIVDNSDNDPDYSLPEENVELLDEQLNYEIRNVEMTPLKSRKRKKVYRLQ